MTQAVHHALIWLNTTWLIAQNVTHHGSDVSLKPTVENFQWKYQRNDADVSAAILQSSSEHTQQNNNSCLNTQGVSSDVRIHSSVHSPSTVCAQVGVQVSFSPEFRTLWTDHEWHLDSHLDSWISWPSWPRIPPPLPPPPPLIDHWPIPALQGILFFFAERSSHWQGESNSRTSRIV